jgi:hypothetical protein
LKQYSGEKALLVVIMKCLSYLVLKYYKKPVWKLVHCLYMKAIVFLIHFLDIHTSPLYFPTWFILKFTLLYSHHLPICCFSLQGKSSSEWLVEIIPHQSYWIT